MVLNLVINGLPSIRDEIQVENSLEYYVLNLVINGLPSIHKNNEDFQTLAIALVLNLVINGLPSILLIHMMKYWTSI